MRRLVASLVLALAVVAGASPAGAFSGPPARHPATWHKVGQELADALAEGDKPDATTYPWERLCLYRQRPHGHVEVRCLDGYRTRL